MAKKTQRTQEQQEYRDNLVRDLKSLRTRGKTGKELAEALLDDQKNTPEYIVSKYGYTNKGAKQLIDAGHGSYLISNLYSFESLDKEVAQKLLENGLWDELRNKQLYQEGGGFEKWDKEFAIKLIENGYLEYVGCALNNFEGLDKDIANKLIEFPRYGERIEYILMNNLDKFEGLDCNEVVDKLLESQNSGFLSNHFNKFWGLNEKTADRLMENGETGTVFYHMDKFDGLNQGIVAKKMIEKGRGHEVAINIHVFKPEYHKEIADELIDSGDGRIIEDLLKNLNKYKGLNYKNIVDKLFEIGKGGLMDYYFGMFEGLDRKEILNKFIEYGLWKNVAMNLKEYEGLSNDIAKTLIQKKRGEYVVYNLDKFEKLDDETILKLIDDNYNLVYTKYGIQGFASSLIKNGYGKNVAENLDKFYELDDETRKIIAERYGKNS